MEKINIFDKPKVITQRFSVSLPNEMGRVTAIRKETIRKIHHMGCTDGLKDDHKESFVDYEIYREVDLKTEQKVIEAIEKTLK